MMSLKSVIVLCLAIASSTAVDYCGDMHCQPNSPHIGCNNPLMNGGYGSGCTDPKEVVMTAELKQAILDIHNKYRNQQAMGKTPNYQPAARMATLKYNDELGKLASLNARTCQFSHDKCHNTKEFSFAGQNIAMSAASGNYQKSSDSESLTKLASGWFEKEHGNGKYYGWMKIINKFQLPSTTDEKKQIGHFTQYVYDEAVSVGCAAVRYTMNQSGTKFDAIYLVCNYSRGNILDAPIYKAGETASKCTTGKNPKYPGLCSETETYQEPMAAF